MSSDNSKNFYRVILLSGIVKQHNWGKPIDSSIISRCFKNITFDSDKPVAELWFGTHKLGIATGIDVACAKSSLKGQNNQQQLLTDILQEWGQAEEKFGYQNQKPCENLPFLAKILSVNSPLSIQCHPNSELSKSLHSNFPLRYSDPLPKPEIGIALTKTRILAGFRQAEVLTALLGLPAFKSFRASSLLETITKMYEASRQQREVHGRTLLELTNSEPLLVSHRDTILYLSKEFGSYDPGIFLTPLLELHELQVGDSISLTPGLVHAYLSGDIFECMTPSDNTIRGGATTKELDIPALLKAGIFEPSEEVHLVHRSNVNLNHCGEQKFDTPISGVVISCLYGFNIAKHSYFLEHPKAYELLIGLGCSVNLKIKDKEFKFDDNWAVLLIGCETTQPQIEVTSHNDCSANGTEIPILLRVSSDK
jgi:mannose-6-phosphate isomerase